MSASDWSSGQTGATVESPRQSDVSILVVDDNPENLIALDAVLGDLGGNIVRAHSGFDALRCLLHNDFALILLDVQMPEMDGFETAAMIRQRKRSAETPIIFLTAVDMHQAQVFRGYSAGAVDYIFKPFDAEILRSKVRVFINLFRKSRKIEAQADELKSAKLKQDAILRGTPLGICTLSSDWIVRWHNLAFSGLFDGDPHNSKNFLGLDLASCFPARQSFREFTERVLRTVRRLGIAMEEQYLQFEGNGFWADISVVQFDPSNDGAGLLATISDVTERHNAVLALRQSEERYALAAQGAADGLWDWDLSANTIYYSERWHEILGYKTGELSNSVEEWFNRIVADDKDRVWSEIKRHLDDPSEHFQSEFQMLDKDGDPIWVLSRGKAVRHDDGVAYRMAGSLSDISGRKKAERELVKRERLASIGMTVSQIAHCTKNTLTALKGAVGLVNSALDESGMDINMVGMQILKSSSARLTTLVLNMLDYSKERVPVFEPVNVPNVLNEVLEELRIAAKKKGVHLTSEIQGAMPVIYCDHQRLLRAVVNLGMNSVDAVPPDVGAVTLKAYVCRAEDADEAATVVPLPGALAQEEAVVIEVSDTGTGIPPDVRGHIFEPFFSTKASRGTGLGLPTVKQFVEDHHGGLFLHSSPEFGTKFQLVFSGAPLAAAEVTENATT